MRRAAIALAALLFAPASGAQESPRDPWERTLSAAGHVGVTPLGFTGVSATVTPVRWLSLEGGGGVALDGPQAALLARGRLFVSRKVAFGFALGPSFGRYVENHELIGCLDVLVPGPCAPTPRRTWDVAVWGNGLVGLEGRTGAGFEWRLFGGAGRLMNGASSCTFGPCATSAPFTGYGGLALGYALPL